MTPEAGARVIAAVEALVREIEREEADAEDEAGGRDRREAAAEEARAAPAGREGISAEAPGRDGGEEAAPTKAADGSGSGRDVSAEPSMGLSRTPWPGNGLRSRRGRRGRRVGGVSWETSGPNGADGPIRPEPAGRNGAGDDVPAETRLARLRRWAAALPARRADALVRLCERGAAAAEPEVRPNPCEIVVHVDVALLAGAPGDPSRAERCELEGGPRLPVETARRLACDAAIVALLEGEGGEPLAIGRRSRAVPAPMRRALAARDRGCRFPGCTARHRLEAHHVRHWAAGGETSARNLASLCPAHHRMVHEGGYGVEVLDDGRLRFTAPGGAPIPECPPPVRLEPEEVEARLVAAERAAGVAVGARTCVPDWDGHGLDRVAAVEGVLAAEDRLLR